MKSCLNVPLLLIPFELKYDFCETLYKCYAVKNFHLCTLYVLTIHYTNLAILRTFEVNLIILSLDYISRYVTWQ
jgi:hypothetical protein